MEKMSIHRALAELKLLDSRISSKTNSTFISVKRKDDGKINGELVEDVVKNIKSNYDSVRDLIYRRSDIKSAIIKSNALTEVEIAGEKMTVAEAIDKKSSIEYDKELLSTLQSQFATAYRAVEKSNNDVLAKAKDFVQQMFSDKNSVDTNKIKEIEDSFISKNSLEFVDPIGLRKTIEELKAKIEEFEMEVDFVLSESNTITLIEI